MTTREEGWYGEPDCGKSNNASDTICDDCGRGRALSAIEAAAVAIVKFDPCGDPNCSDCAQRYVELHAALVRAVEEANK